MQRYDTYKDSGVKWLGEIPSHWESIPLKKCFISSESGLWGDDPKQNDDDAICIRVADFDYSKFSIKTEHLTLRSYGNLLSENKKLTKGDLLLEKSGGGELFPVGRVVRFNLDLGKTTCSNFIQKLSPSQKYCSSFLCYLFSTMYTKKVNGLFYNQTTGIQNLKIKEYLNQTVFLPPLEEQTAIAAYLDTATAKIDAAIAQQQKMIDLLNERKQIIINRAVTKGLNPNVIMKDSGVEWIGVIPEKWEVCALKHYCLLTNGDRGPNYPSGEDIKDSGVLFATADNIHGLRIEVKDGTKYITKEKYNTLRGAKMRKGDIVFCLRGAGFGNCAINDLFDEGTIASSLVNITPLNIDCEFMNYVLHSAYIRMQEIFSSNGSCADNVSAQDLGDYLIVVPQKDDQKKIVNAITSTILPIDRLIKNTNNQISLLQERKQIIINEVVTGKVKVV